MICKHILLITFSNQTELIFLLTVKSFQVLNGQTLLFLTIQFSINQQS